MVAMRRTLPENGFVESFGNGTRCKIPSKKMKSSFAVFTAANNDSQQNTAVACIFTVILVAALIFNLTPYLFRHHDKYEAVS